jgi:hypothetical protein
LKSVEVLQYIADTHIEGADQEAVARMVPCFIDMAEKALKNREEIADIVDEALEKDYVCIRFKADYSGEFYVYGIAICKADNWEGMKANAEQCDFPQELTFGIEQAVVIGDYEEWLKGCRTEKMTQTAAVELCKYLGLNHQNLENFGCATWGNFLQPVGN